MKALIIALVLAPSFAFADGDIDRIVADCEYSVKSEVQRLEELGQQTSVDTAIEMMSECVAREARRSCSPNDDRCYP